MMEYKYWKINSGENGEKSKRHGTAVRTTVQMITSEGRGFVREDMFLVVSWFSGLQTTDKLLRQLVDVISSSEATSLGTGWNKG